MIKLDSVSKEYHRRSNVIHALRPTSFEVAAGEFVAIIGPSGSGKTTLLSILGGMLAPSRGDVLINQHSLYSLSTKRRSRLRNEQMGFVFQSFNLVPWLSALENVQLPLSLYGADDACQRSRALELLERFGLQDRMDHRPSELSVGQQQRVALARTLAMNPPFILADEPTGNLDTQSRDLVMSTLKELQAEGRTIILVTHDPTVSAAAERVLHIADGEVSEVEAAAETHAA